MAHKEESEAERIAREAKERELERLQAQKERERQYRGDEPGAESKREPSEKEDGYGHNR
ncbi:MAG: hypothetical protein WBD74_06390 [Candidatus Aquilonibacter sp.]